jgi:hypothetical protein
MTMHLAQGLSTISTKKREVKLTKARIAELRESWHKHNKDMKRNGMHDMRYSNFDDYVDYCFGRKKVDKKKFSTASYTPPKAWCRDDHRDRYPSMPLGSIDTGSCRKVESPKYTGTLVKGIATMHKSNAVPVIDQKQAEEISRMAR